MHGDDVLCTGASKCHKLKGVTHTIHYGSKDIEQRPEYCSGRYPHRFNHEECVGMFCLFIKEWVECKRIYMRIPV